MINTKKPTTAQQRLWQARIKNELLKGTHPEQTTQIMKEMIDAWHATEGAIVNKTVPGNLSDD